jgi:pimeloyl-ACP methyl ester carboxylesterase
MPASVRKEKSTTGRLDFWLRPAVHAASRMSPALAGEVASRWFFRTARLELSDEERAAIERGRPRVIGFRGSTLNAWSFGEGPAVLLVHGWNGRGGQLAPLAIALARAGHTAIVFDAPAHGDSPGSATTVPEMARAARVVADAYGGVSAVVAHSLGAAAVSLALAEGWALERAVMIAPPVSPEDWVERFASALGLSDDARVELRRAIERRAGVPFEQIEPLTHARSARAELLVIHDMGDREVPFAAGQAISQAWPGAELVRTVGLGHRRILSDAEVIAHAIRFLSPPFQEPASDLTQLVG